MQDYLILNKDTLDIDTVISRGKIMMKDSEIVKENLKAYKIRDTNGGCPMEPLPKGLLMIIGGAEDKKEEMSILKNLSVF